MIIGIDASRAAAGPRTGTEGYAYHLIRAVLPLAAAGGHLVRLYFNEPPREGLFPSAGPGLDYVVIPQRRLWTHSRLRRELKRRPPDVFFTPAHVIPIGYGGPSVATIHDLGYEQFPEAHPRRQLAYLRWSTRHNARVARRVLADSAATRDDLVRLYATPTDKIEVVYPGADPAVQRVTDQAQLTAVLDKYSIRAPYLLYLGTLQPRKNLVRLVESFAVSGLHERGYALVLAGRVGWLAEPLLETVRGLPAGVRERVLLPGYIDEVDKAALLSAAAALVFPSLYEGFGFPVLEAQACGTPVLCSNTSSLPEAAGRGALLVDPLDVDGLAAALIRVVEDANLRRELVDSGEANLRRFSWEDAAAKVLGILESVAVGA